jgi:hypothetical protein
MKDTSLHPDIYERPTISVMSVSRPIITTFKLKDSKPIFKNTSMNKTYTSFGSPVSAYTWNTLLDYYTSLPASVCSERVRKFMGLTSLGLSEEEVEELCKPREMADHTFFSATFPHQRIRGQELFERVARKFVDELLSAEPGQILKLADAYAVFRELLRARELPDIKRSDFKAVVGPLIREQFSVALRNDLGGAAVRGWKGVRMLQSGPGSSES